MQHPSDRKSQVKTWSRELHNTWKWRWLDQYWPLNWILKVGAHTHTLCSDQVQNTVNVSVQYRQLSSNSTDHWLERQWLGSWLTNEIKANILQCRELWTLPHQESSDKIYTKALTIGKFHQHNITHPANSHDSPSQSHTWKSINSGLIHWDCCGAFLSFFTFWYETECQHHEGVHYIT